jgi:hypothetical protein
MVDDEFRGDCKPLQSRISKSTKTYLHHHHHHHISPETQKQNQNLKEHGEAAFNSQFTILDSIPILSLLCLSYPTLSLPPPAPPSYPTIQGATSTSTSELIHLHSHRYPPIHPSIHTSAICARSHAARGAKIPIRSVPKQNRKKTKEIQKKKKAYKKEALKLYILQHNKYQMQIPYPLQKSQPRLSFFPSFLLPPRVHNGSGQRRESSIPHNLLLRPPIQSMPMPMPIPIHPPHPLTPSIPGIPTCIKPTNPIPQLSREARLVLVSSPPLPALLTALCIAALLLKDIHPLSKHRQRHRAIMAPCGRQ